MASTAPGRMPVSYELQQKWEAWKRLGVHGLVRWSRPPCSSWPPPCRAAAAERCFHVIWNQEREAAGLDQKECPGHAPPPSM